MKLYSCARESEVVTALREQRWPEVCEPELRAHVEGCSSCTDLVRVAQAMQQAHRAATREAQLPSPGILWWRAQVQRRNGAIERVTKPIVLAEKIAWAGTCLVAIALIIWQRHNVGDWFGSLWSFSERASWSTANGWIIALFAAAVGTLGLLGGLAVYLVAKQD
jgi:hypothetical protein